MIGVIADDITGSNDIGVMFAKSNYITDIYSFDEHTLAQLPEKKPDVLIFDTNSRFDTSQTAYNKVFQATKAIKEAGASQFYNKTCSVFRGNIGSEFDAMLDALEEEFAVIVLGFPKNGRQTIDSIHYVHGNKLEDSEFKDDPMHPMTESNLITILKSQTNRNVGAVHSNIISKGSKAIKTEIQRIKDEQNYQYVILDVQNQSDLFEIAQAIHNEKVICGSSAIAEEIAKVNGPKKFDNIDLPNGENSAELGLFCSAGSLMKQTYDQVEYMKSVGSQVIELNTLSLMTSVDKSAFINSVVTRVIESLNDGHDVILHSSNTPKQVEATKSEGNRRGWSKTEVSQFVSETIAKITSEVISNTGQRRFVIAGGDTSAAVCHALNIRGMRVWEEIQPGLPSCLSLTSPSYFFVLKSGSFGNPNFIEEAFAHLRQGG